MIKISAIKGSSNLLFILFAVLALMAGITLYSSQQSDKTKMPDVQTITLLPNPKPLADNNFTDHAGSPFNKQQFKNKWSLVFFGFTNCPDICPTTLHTLKQIKQSVQSANAWDNYQVVFVSVDPKRDTVERLSKYIPFFDNSFIGITGDEQSTLEFTKKLGIIYAYHEANKSGDYNVDHSASILLINPQAELAGIISAPHNAENIANDLIKLGNSNYNKKLLSNTKQASTQLLSVQQVPAQQISDQQAPNSKQAEQDIEISNAWVRAAPPGATTLAAYMSIQNNSSSPITISQVSSPQFAMSMLHETIIENGVASMQHSTSLTIEAGKSNQLKPQANHIMLMTPKKDFSIGDEITITVTTDTGNNITVTAEVRAK